jgi:beta-glucosidase
MNKKCLFFYCLFFGVNIAFAQKMPYQNAKLSTEKRVADLFARMTVEEKFWQLFMIPGDLDNAKPDQYANGIFGFQVSAGKKGDAAGQLLSYNTTENATAVVKKINAIQKYFVEKTRLGIPIIAFDEALHGLVREGATAFPQAIGLAATWDTVLMKQVSTQIALETQQRGIRQILSPVVNLATDVRWGRTEETYGEDPILTAKMGVAFVKSFEDMGIITTPKHFVANVGDGGRDSYPIHLSERYLEETHFIPFKALIKEGGARSIMTAYNSLNGTASSSNSWLLLNKLKKQWGFGGFVISDANAVGGELVLHNTAKDYAESGKNAVEGGLDVIFQTEYEHYKLFNPLFMANKVDTARINDAVSRVLKAKFDLGLFENPYVSEKIDDKKLLIKSRQVANEAAKASFVLLKNDNQLLPLGKNIKTIAVFGADATEARLGGYSGPGNNKVSILDGIKKRAGNIKVVYASGADRNDDAFAIIPSKYLESDGKSGLKASYFDNIDFNPKPVLTQTDAQIDFHWTLFPPNEKLKVDFYSIRWEGNLIAPKTGEFKIGLEGNDGYRLYINDQLIVDKWSKQSYHLTTENFKFEEGKKYKIKVEFFESQGEGKIKLIWNALQNDNWEQKIDSAIAVAKNADVAIAVVGINEGEFLDRAMLNLPGHQEQLIKALTKTGKPLVVLLVGGSAINMQNWLGDVSSVLNVWYPGEDGGNAVASTLFGDYNPAGRLPITYPVHEAQLPLVYNHQPTGRGNDYNNLSGQPLFPFGYGLSYTTFAYSDIKLKRNHIKPNESTELTFNVKNTGSRNGDEVVQLYIRDILSSMVRPLIELKDFKRINLQAGQTQQVTFRITPKMLSMLDKNMKTSLEPGDFRIMIGASSKDLRLKTILTVQP